MNLMHDRNLQYLLMLGFIVKKDFFYYIPSFTSTTAILAGKFFVVTKPLGFDQVLFKQQKLTTSLRVCFLNKTCNETSGLIGLGSNWEEKSVVHTTIYTKKVLTIPIKFKVPEICNNL